MGQTLIAIQQGDPVVAESAVTFLGAGSAGDPTACRRLVFPASVSPLLAPIVYAVGSPSACLNPTTTLGLDNVALTHPITSTVRTIGTTKTVRFESVLADVVVTEVWEPTRGAAMPTSLFRLLYEYLVNATLIDATAGPFIQWEPRDRTTRIYNVELLSLSVGGGEGESRFNIRDIREAGGQPLTLDGALSGLNPTPTGLIDEEVELRMKVISEVV